MIERYSLPEMKKIWSDETRFRKWLDVEIAVCEAWTYLGKIPEDALKRIKEKANFSIERISEIEKETKHDLVAFTTSVSEFIGEDSRFFHMGLTSYDVVDTALSLLINDSLDLIIKKAEKFSETLKEKALKYKYTPIIGRTHGVHAEPVTLGFKFLIWYAELKRDIERLKRAKENIRIGRISGSVGTYSHLDPEVEEIVCKKLGLIPEKVSSQVIQRDRHSEVIAALSILSSTIEKISTEIRHLQRTEVLEAEEFFLESQKGSSSMPHKRNPVRSERISGISRLIRSHVNTSLENNLLWHERDISHSSSERIMFPDVFLLSDFILEEINDVISNLIVYPERMKENIQITKGVIFSQRLLLLLGEKGLSREKAYKIVQEKSMKAWNEKISLKELIKTDEEIMDLIGEKELEDAFDMNYFFRNIDYIFNRVLSD
ncbi:MAG: adenylosuccinate lyase [Acidobacteriota bacterium]